MKKLILSLIVMAFASTAALAQTSSPNITVSADVAAAIAFANVNNVDFGTIQVDDDAFLSPIGDATPSNNVGSTASLGTADVTGSGTALISWTNGILTDSDDQSRELTFTPVITDGTTVLTNNVSTLSLSAVAISLSIGGNLTGVVAAGAESYSTANGGNGAPVVITLQYN
jgi:hypothetical protein